MIKNDLRVCKLLYFYYYKDILPGTEIDLSFMYFKTKWGFPEKTNHKLSAKHYNKLHNLCVFHNWIWLGYQRKKNVCVGTQMSIFRRYENKFEFEILEKNEIFILSRPDE